MKAKLISIKIIETEDQSPDLSHLGAFSNQRGDFAVEHEPNNGRLFNWFNAANVETQEQAEENYKRAASYGNRWWYVGIKAEAVIHLPISKHSNKVQTIDSGGLWGIESDSEVSYREEVAREQVAELKGYLETLNVDTSNIAQLTEQAIKKYI